MAVEMSYIWDAKVALNKFKEFNRGYTKEFLQRVWLIGDDLGDLIYFYGNGNSGMGLYRTSDGDMSFEYADKVADSLTEFLVDGVGIDVAITL